MQWGIRNKMIYETSGDLNYAVSVLPSSVFIWGVEDGAINCKGCPFCIKNSTFDFKMKRWTLYGTKFFEDELDALNYGNLFSGVIEMEVVEFYSICETTGIPQCPHRCPGC
jgi:hypothetical protein